MLGRSVGRGVINISLIRAFQCRSRARSGGRSTQQNTKKGVPRRKEAENSYFILSPDFLLQYTCNSSGYRSPMKCGWGKYLETRERKQSEKIFDIGWSHFFARSLVSSRLCPRCSKQTNELLYLDALPSTFPPLPFLQCYDESISPPLPPFPNGSKSHHRRRRRRQGQQKPFHPAHQVTRRDSDKRCRLIRIFLPPVKRGKRSARACAEMKFWRKEGDASNSKRHNSESCASGTRKKVS